MNGKPYSHSLNRTDGFFGDSIIGHQIVAHFSNVSAATVNSRLPKLMQIIKEMTEGCQGWTLFEAQIQKTPRYGISQINSLVFSNTSVH